MTPVQWRKRVEVPAIGDMQNYRDLVGETSRAAPTRDLPQ